MRELVYIGSQKLFQGNRGPTDDRSEQYPED